MIGNLREFRSLLRELRWICESSTIPGEFQVIGMYCYAADKTFLSTVTPAFIIEGKESVLLYDIVITDGIDKLKCFLAMPLGFMVHRHLLQIGDVITITAVKLCYLEGEFGDKHIVMYILLEGIEIRRRSSVPLFPLGNISFLDSHNIREIECRPLVTGRKHYLNVWAPHVPFGSQWTDPTPFAFDDNSPRPMNFLVLSDLDENWRRLPTPYPALLLKVIVRGKMHHFGHNKADRSYPIVGYVKVVDSTGHSEIAIFSSMAMAFYSLKPGTIILLEQYVVEEKRREVPIAALPGNVAILAIRPSLIDIKLNEHSRLKIIPEDSNTYSTEIATLPDFEFAFVDRAALRYVAAGTKIDIVGLITYVSSYYRVTYKLKTYLPGIWLELTDGTSYLPFRVFLFVDPNRFSMTDIRPGKLIVCTQLKVFLATEYETPDRDDAVYLQSSVFSEVYCNLNSATFASYPAVQKIAYMIRDCPEEVDFLRNNVLRSGGFFTFPKLSRLLIDHEDEERCRMPRKMLPGPVWGSALENLGYREKGRMILGGFIVHVDFIDYQSLKPDDLDTGWSYANFNRRTFLYQNIRAINSVRQMRVLNAGHHNKFMFPLKWSSTLEDEFKAFLDFPPTTADSWLPPPSEDLNAVPANVDGYYVLTVASLHYQAFIECVYVPQPSEQPYPSFIQLLSGQFRPLPFRQISTFLGEPPRYTWAEVKRASRTVHEVADRTMIFLVDFYRPKAEQKQAILQRAFLCPPDQIAEAMLADQEEQSL